MFSKLSGYINIMSRFFHPLGLPVAKGEGIALQFRGGFPPESLNPWQSY
jgi:hypothetical protein